MSRHRPRPKPTISAARREYDETNLLRAKRILANLDANGGPDGLAARWARAVMRRLGYTDLWDHDLPREEALIRRAEDGR